MPTASDSLGLSNLGHDPRLLRWRRLGDHHITALSQIEQTFTNHTGESGRIYLDHLMALSSNERSDHLWLVLVI